MTFKTGKTIVNFSDVDRDLARRMGELFSELREKMLKENAIGIIDPDEQYWSLNDEIEFFIEMCISIYQRGGDWQFNQERRKEMSVGTILAIIVGIKASLIIITFVGDKIINH